MKCDNCKEELRVVRAQPIKGGKIFCPYCNTELKD